MPSRPPGRPGRNQDSRRQRRSARDDNDSEPDTAIPHNAPHDEGYGHDNLWDVIADYVFQNSNAQSVLMHTSDFGRIQTTGGTGNLRVALANSRPTIVVDEDGVGMLARDEDQQLEELVEQSNTLTLMDPRSTSALMKVATWDRTSQDVDQALTTVLEAEDYLDCITNLQARGIDPSSYINGLDEIIDDLPVDSHLRKRCIRALSKTCGLYGILPISYNVTLALSEPGPRAASSTKFSDTWKLTDAADSNRVFAVKSLRIYEHDPVKEITEKCCQAIVILKRTKHPNVLSIEGVAPKLFEFCMVSQWMPNGNLLEYTGKHPDVNRLDLLNGVARGLSHLHDNDVVHGDLKSSNILIDAAGTPRLADFGLFSIKRIIDSVNTSTPNHGRTVRYCAPELLDANGAGRVEEKKPTTKSDIYSLSMVIVELITGNVPFVGYTDPGVIIFVSRGKRPAEPRNFDAPGMSPAVWKLAEKCWHQNAEERPDAEDVLLDLERVTLNTG